MVRNTRWMVALALAIVLVVMGCASPSTPTPGIPPTDELPAGQPTPEPTAGGNEDEPIIKEAPVDSVELLMMESFPLQMSAIVRGNLPDGCTEISHWELMREVTAIRITLFTCRPADAICTQALVAYEESIPVDILGLPAGEYVVSVNSVEATFTLDVDNVAPEAD
jgi:inhibitor of cysteine peptidase